MLGRASHDRVPAAGQLRPRRQGPQRLSAGGRDDRANRRFAPVGFAAVWHGAAAVGIQLGGDAMNATRTLRDLGQSLWLDNVTRALLNSGTLQRYIDELSVTGLTSNPTIFDHAIKNSSDYDADIAGKAHSAKSREDLFFDLALTDLTRAAELFRPIHERTDRVDGWVSLEVSPLLAHDTARTVAAARDLHSRGGVPNLFIKIPGTKEGLPAIEAAGFAGIPINVTLLFSREQ